MKSSASSSVFLLVLFCLVSASFGKLSSPSLSETPSVEVRKLDDSKGASERQTKYYHKKKVTYKLLIDCNHKTFQNVSTQGKIDVTIFDKYGKIIGEGYFHGCHYTATTFVHVMGEPAKVLLTATTSDAVFIDSLRLTARSIHYKKRIKDNVCLSTDPNDPQAIGWRVKPTDAGTICGNQAIYTV